MPANHRPEARKFLVVLGLLLLAGIPLVGFLWSVLNELLAGHVRPGQLALAAPLFLAFLALMAWAGRTFLKLTGEPVAEPTPAEEPVVAGTLIITAFILMFMFGAWATVYLLLLNR